MENKLSTRIAVTLLAVIFLCGNLLNYPFFRFAVAQVKSEMRREIIGVSAGEAKEAVCISLSAEKYALARVNDDELCLDGNWYDVISVSRHNGMIAVKCLSDKKESVLQAWMNHVTNENGSPFSPVKSGKQLKAAFSGDYLPSENKDIHFVCGKSLAAAFATPGHAPAPGHSSLPDLPPRS